MINYIKNIFNKSTAYYVLYKGNDDQYYWHLKAPNHKIIASSEGYETKAMAIKGIRSVRKNAITLEIKEK